MDQIFIVHVEKDLYWCASSWKPEKLVQNKVLFSPLMQTTNLFNSQDFQGYQEA